MRKLLTLAFLLISLVSLAQDPIYGDQDFKGNISMSGTFMVPILDTTGNKPRRAGALTIRPQDTSAVNPPVYAWSGTPGNKWNVVNGAAASTYTSNNGITLTGQNFQLTGGLVKNTLITPGNFWWSMGTDASLVKQTGKNFILDTTLVSAGVTRSNGFMGWNVSPLTINPSQAWILRNRNVVLYDNTGFKTYDTTGNVNLAINGAGLTLTSNNAYYSSITPTVVDHPYLKATSAGAQLPQYTNTDTTRFMQFDASGNIIQRNFTIGASIPQSQVIGLIDSLNARYTILQAFQHFVDLNGSYVNPSWITSLPWSKITATPTTLSGYGITDAIINQTTLQTGAVYNVDRGLITQASGTTTTTALPAAIAAPFTIAGGNGINTTANTGTVIAGRAGDISVRPGQGGNQNTAGASFGGGGRGGNIDITAGNGGLGNGSGMISGNGGTMTVQGGDAGPIGTGAISGEAGFLKLASGSANPGSNGNGKSVFIIPGAGYGTGFHGDTYIGTSPALVYRGRALVGFAVDASLITTKQIFQVNGTSWFKDTLTLSNIASKILKTDASGNVIPAVPGTDYLSSVSSGNLTETGSSILTVTGGTGAVLGSGTTLQVKQATTGQSGYLSSTDWNTFNNKLTSVDTTNISNFNVKVRSLFSGTAPITYANGLIGITQATTSTNGYLTSTDWNTFNGKQAAFGTQAANTVYAGPTTGGSATPGFRALVTADIPTTLPGYIQNQTAINQAASFSVSGTGFVNGNLQSGATLSSMFTFVNQVNTSISSAANNLTAHYQLKTALNGARWSLGTVNLENGLNVAAGSDFALSSYDDANNVIGYALFIRRATRFVGVADSIPTSTLSVQGSFAAPIRTITANRTLDATDYTIRATTSGITITLPSASTCPRRIYIIINYNSGGTITLSSYLNNGAAGPTIGNNLKVWVQSDGTNWYQIN